MRTNSLGYVEVRALLALGASIEMEWEGWTLDNLKGLARAASEGGSVLTLHGSDGHSFTDLQGIAMAGKTAVKFA